MKDLNQVPNKPKRGRPASITDEVKDTDINPEDVTPVVQELPDGVTKEAIVDDDYTLEIVRDFDGKVDPFYLSKKNPEYEYRFLRDEQKNLSIKTGNLLFQKGGWQICPKSHLLKLGIKEMELSPDGFLRRGDTVLAFMPKKLAEEKSRYKFEQANAPMSAIKRLVKDGDPSAGKGIHESMKGIQTAKQLGLD